MSNGIVPLRLRGEQQSALPRVDAAAADRLADGQVTLLQAARVTIMLADLCEHRAPMTALLTDLRGRAPTGDAPIDGANADLIRAINQGIVQIDQLAAGARDHAKETTSAE